jgi:hypothetical protein
MRRSTRFRASAGDQLKTGIRSAGTIQLPVNHANGRENKNEEKSSRTKR